MIFCSKILIFQHSGLGIACGALAQGTQRDLQHLYGVAYVKHREYEVRVWEIEHGNFSSLVFSSSGGMDASTTVVYKRLTFLLSCKWKTPYCSALPSWILSFAISHHVHQGLSFLLQGSHSSFSWSCTVVWHSRPTCGVVTATFGTLQKTSASNQIA